MTFIILIFILSNYSIFISDFYLLVFPLKSQSHLSNYEDFFMCGSLLNITSKRKYKLPYSLNAYRSYAAPSPNAKCNEGTVRDMMSHENFSSLSQQLWENSQERARINSLRKRLFNKEKLTYEDPKYIYLGSRCVI